jgi:hyperosmotically inducible periplasmic protein
MGVGEALSYNGRRWAPMVRAAADSYSGAVRPVRQRTDPDDGSPSTLQETTMSSTPTRTLSRRLTLTLTATVAALTLVLASGCAVTRGQESVGAYVDDTAITTAVKARYIDNREVDASSISVETLHGTVMLSGFAKSVNERVVAERLAMQVGGVKAVRNEIAVRP